MDEVEEGFLVRLAASFSKNMLSLQDAKSSHSWEARQSRCIYITAFFPLAPLAATHKSNEKQKSGNPEPGLSGFPARGCRFRVHWL